MLHDEKKMRLCGAVGPERARLVKTEEIGFETWDVAWQSCFNCTCVHMTLFLSPRGTFF